MAELDAPVTDESTILAPDLVVQGAIPPRLSGVYLQIGPNPIGDRSRPDAMVHGVWLHGGRALAYRNRWVGTDATNRVLGAEPVAGPRPSRPDRADRAD